MSIEHTEKRYKANMELVETLKAMLMAYPDMRFSQALANFDFVIRQSFTNDLNMVPDNGWSDEYHLEPMLLIKRVKRAIEKLG